VIKSDVVCMMSLSVKDGHLGWDEYLICTEIDSNFFIIRPQFHLALAHVILGPFATAMGWS